MVNNASDVRDGERCRRVRGSVSVSGSGSGSGSGVDNVVNFAKCLAEVLLVESSDGESRFAVIV